MAMAAASSLIRRASSQLLRVPPPRPMLPYSSSSTENPFAPAGPAPCLPEFPLDSGDSMDLMAVPKKKVSRYKKGLRNGPKALKPTPVIVRCKSGGVICIFSFSLETEREITKEWEMSYMKGDLLTKTRKLVKGLAKPTPRWLKPMEQAPPVVFPRTDGKIKTIEMSEDVYVKEFFKKHPDSLYHDAVKISGFEPPPARVFAWRVLELKDQGVCEEEAMAVADMEYRTEKKAKKNAYKELKKISPLLGKKPPPNPYPSAIKEIQAEEKKYVRDRFFNPRIRDIVRKLKDEKLAEYQERQNGRNMTGGNQQGGRPGGQHW